jgi:acyl dehydratase
LTAPTPWRLKAFNTATTSNNKIHDDEVARSYGFAGGLVPGVDVYAYLTHPPVERWGMAFLERGTMSARFHQPVYDGDEVTVEVVDAVEQGNRMTLTLFDSRGETCATASASLTASAPEPPALEDFVAGPLPLEPPPASPELLGARPEFGSLEFGFHVENAPSYLHDVGETLPLYAQERVAHPGWLLRSANYVLTENVRLGPWIHVSSAVQHHGLVHDGDEVSTRAHVIDNFERKGHKFVVLDVLMVANFTRPVMRVEHTAIYEPRRVLPHS